MEQRTFGETGFMVSALGLGAGEVGREDLSDEAAGRLLNQALDLGITLIDTARGYGLSEERIGRYLRTRRSEYVLSTKVGYDIPGYENWTGPCITAGIDAALQRLQTDTLDIVHFHSCPLGVLQNSDIIPALLDAVKAGKVRVAAYSGDNQAAEWSAAEGPFASLQTSINIADQRAIDTLLPQASRRGLGVIAKRPVANAPWRYQSRPVGKYCEVYWERLQEMDLDPSPYEWQELALRFTAYLPGVHSCIVGTANIEHLRQNTVLIQKGPLPSEKVDYIRQAFIARGKDWDQQT